MHAKLCIIIYVVTHVDAAMYVCVMWLASCMSLIVCKLFEVIADKSILILTVVVGAFRNI